MSNALTEYNISIKVMIRAYMRELNLKAKDVADVLDATDHAVSNWRSPIDVTTPDLVQQGQLCKLFRCTFRELHGDFSPTAQERFDFQMQLRPAA